MANCGLHEHLTEEIAHACQVNRLNAEVERLRADSNLLHELFAIAADRRCCSEIIGIRVRNELVRRATPEYLAQKSNAEQDASK